MHPKSIPDYLSALFRSKDLMTKWGNTLADVLPIPANLLAARITSELEQTDSLTPRLVEHMASELGEHVAAYYHMLPLQDEGIDRYVAQHAEDIVRWFCLYHNVGQMFNRMQNEDTAPTDIVNMFNTDGITLGSYNLTSLNKMELDESQYQMGMMTGIQALDQYTRGLLPRQLGLLIGAYGVGKTTVLICFGISALKQGCKLLHVTLEIGQNEVFMKYLRGMCRDDQALMEDTQQLLGDKLFVLEADSGTFTIPSLRQAMLRVQPTMVILDYADEMYVGEHDGLYQPLGVLFRKLRSLAQQFNIPMWTASQTRRSGINKGLVTGEEVSNSIEKMRIVDQAITINQVQEEYLKHELRLFLDKNRNGPKHKTVRCYIDYECPRLQPYQG